MKSAEEIMRILEACDLTGSYRDAGDLAGCSHHTVARYVRARKEAGVALTHVTGGGIFGVDNGACSVHILTAR